jgi:hypothetical protein
VFDAENPEAEPMVFDRFTIGEPEFQQVDSGR